MVQNKHLKKSLTQKVYEQIVKQYEIYKKFGNHNKQIESIQKSKSQK